MTDITADAEVGEDSAPLPPDSGILCLVMMLRFLHVPADPGQLLHQFGDTGRELDSIGLVRAAKSLGLKAKVSWLKQKHWARTPLPAIGRDRDGRYFILGKIADDKGVIQRPGAQPETVSLDRLAETWGGEAILLTTRAKLAGDARRFDFTWFIPAIVKYRKLFGEVLLASFFIQLFGLVTPLFFQVVIDKVLVHRGLTTLDVLVIGLIALTLFEVILQGLRTYIFSHTAFRVDVELSSQLFKHLLGLPIAYFQARQVGQTVARVRELENIREFLTGSAMTLVLNLLFTFVFFGVMYHISPTLTLIVLGSIPFYVAVSIAITGPLRRRVEERFQRGAVQQSFLVESISGVETLKAMAVEPQMRRRWEEILAAYVQSSFKVVKLGTVGSQSVQLINKVVVALILWFGAHRVIGGDMTVGQLVAFNMLAAQVSQPILRMAQLWQDFQEFRISIARLGDVLNTPAEATHNPNRQTPPGIDGEVRFDHVSFRYRPDTPEVLKDVDLAIPAGQFVGIVGRSGSGKSTLAKLVQRLYVPARGRVLVDGIDVAMIDPAWLRRQVGVVLQENVLFNSSVRDNIALGNPAFPMSKVIEAATLAGAHEFILELPEGYDTVLGERGSTLSGGQRQRIAIARALISDPRILIFDEATSALDYESEHIIQQNMRAISKGRTVLVIAHRLSTVRAADRIITVDEGWIVEDGSHDDLLARDGRYAKLYRRQLGTA